MVAQKRSRLAALRARIARVWSELGYANRRMFDIRTGDRLMDGSREPDSGARATRRAAISAR
jgi:hypothetical protein